MIRSIVARLACMCLACLGFYHGFGQDQAVFALEQQADKPMLVVAVGDGSQNGAGALDKTSLYTQVRVYVGNHDAIPEENVPPVAGNYDYEAGKIFFRPFVPFRSGLTYTAFFREKTSFQFTIPQTAGLSAPEITAVYPSADTLPANQLKFYLHFSMPMAEGQAYRNLILTDERGDTISAPFVRLEPELWNSEHTRLTLWMDPGRVKRALGPNEAEGAPLETGRRYTLYILPGWKSREGQALEQTYRKAFYAGPDDRQKPSPDQWRLETAAADTRRPLRLCFGEPLDGALARQSITILREEGGEVLGEVELAASEKEWRFVPEEPWSPGRYRIRIDARLEDLAGNNLNRLFDRDLFEEPQLSPYREYYYLEFSVH